MTKATPPKTYDTHSSSGEPRQSSRHTSRYVVLPIAFVGFFFALKKAFGEATMPGAEMLRVVVFIPLMSALLTGCIPLVAGIFRAQNWGRRAAKLGTVILLLALTLPLAFCSLAFDVRFT